MRLLISFASREAIRRGWISYVAAFVLILISTARCHAGDIVFIHSSAGPSPEQHKLDIAAQYYGLNLRVIKINANYPAAALNAAKASATLAVVIDADALSIVRQRSLLQSLNRRPKRSVPLLILGVTPQTDAAALGRWSGAGEIGVKRLTATTRLSYVVGQIADITNQLSGLDIPFPGRNALYFSLGKNGKIRKILMIRKNDAVVPVFIEADLPQQKVFLLSATYPSDETAEGSTNTVVDAFAQVAPFMIFLKHCAGEQGWHSVRHYANLTIDDPWLRKSYGGLNYEGLLREMETHNFHTTIAFIPWNYSRSEAEVVSLFRNHPDRLSICVHGNNHDHKEFEDLESRPINDQVADLKQALARMDKFQELTGIPYDKVFVFPHSIGPELTLEKLKAYNYIATVNSSNIPMGEQMPPDPLYSLRPVTMSFGDFPSIMRYSAAMENPTAFIAINGFLDNPLLFYAHQDFFVKGANTFNPIADEVNKLAPDTSWASLGEIVKHLYLLRERDDLNYDVLAFANTITLENASKRSTVFIINKAETASSRITLLSVNGSSVPFQLVDGNLCMSITIPAGETRTIEIKYANDLDLVSTDITHNSMRIYLLRRASDFRDIVMSKYHVGEMLTAFYYKDNMTPTQTIAYISFVIVLSIGAIAGVVIAIRRRNLVKTVFSIAQDRAR